MAEIDDHLRSRSPRERVVKEAIRNGGFIDLDDVIRLLWDDFEEYRTRPQARRLIESLKKSGLLVSVEGETCLYAIPEN